MKVWSKTTVGLVKTVNEDFLGQKADVFCLCDGHWGADAAKMVGKTVLAKFPDTKSRAITLLSQVEQALAQIHKSEYPPETSVVAIQIKQDRATILSYGDCRLLIVRQGKIVFANKTVPTWLGPLSRHAIRGRLLIQDALVFHTIAIQPKDRIMLFSDGIDECVYEQPTISYEWLARHSPIQIFKRVFAHGAEDNASLITITC